MDNVLITTDDNISLSNEQSTHVNSDPNIFINQNIVEGGGEGATIQIGSVETLPPDQLCYVHNVGDEHNAIFNFGIVRGYNGRDGVDGLDGTNGTDGFSPIATVTQTETGATISITDATETTNATIYNGTDGTDGISPIATVTEITNGVQISITDAIGTTTENVYNGTDGSDGISPIATVTQNTGSATISITDLNGTTTATVYDGTDGTDGTDGFSPIATVTPTASGATISITDLNGTTTASITNGIDGTDGTDGSDGFSPIATVTQNTGSATISITDSQGTTTATVYDGVDGTDGTDGTDGITPSITATASVDNTTGTPAVTVTKSGTDANPAFAFAFTHLKGNTGANGADAIVRTTTDSNGITGIYYENGTLISYRKYTGSMSVSTTTGSLYLGVLNVNLNLAPTNDNDYIEAPIVSITPCATSTQRFFLDTEANATPAIISNRYQIPSGSIGLLRPTSHTNVNYGLDIIAFGKWK